MGNGRYTLNHYFESIVVQCLVSTDQLAILCNLVQKALGSCVYACLFGCLLPAFTETGSIGTDTLANHKIAVVHEASHAVQLLQNLLQHLMMDSYSGIVSFLT